MNNIQRVLAVAFVLLIAGLFVQWGRVERVRAKCQLDGRTRQQCDLMITAGELKP